MWTKTYTGSIVDAQGDLKAAKFVLFSDSGKQLGFVYYPGKEAELKKRIDRKVTVRGTQFGVPKWKNPVIVVQILEEVD